MTHENGERKKAPFKVGDKVTTDYRLDYSAVVRTILSVRKDKRCSSGYALEMDGGEACPTCNRPPDYLIYGVDSEWAKKVEP
jgi:hypothetical protein